MKKILSIVSFLFIFLLSSCFLTVKEKVFYFGDNYMITLDNTFYQKEPKYVENSDAIEYGFGGSKAGIAIYVNLGTFQVDLEDESINVIYDGRLEADKKITYTQTKDDTVYIYTIISKFSGDVIYKVYTIYSDDYKDIYNDYFDIWCNSIKKY